MDISVVIATHNQKERLRLVLAGLRHQRFPETRFEVIVVDDGCTDGTGEMLKEMDEERPLQVVSLSPHQGRCWARNQGVAAARGELVAFLDGDALPHPDWLLHHGNAWEQHGPDGLLCGMEYSLPELEYLQDPQTGAVVAEGVPGVVREYLRRHRQEMILTEAMICTDFDAIHRRARIGGYPFPELETLQEQIRDLFTQYPDSPIGWIGFFPHNGAVPRIAFEQVGGFDEEIPFSEGWELAYRLQQAGIKPCFVSQAMTYHQQEGDTIGMLSEYAALGALYQEQGELAKAEGMYLKALGVGEKLEVPQVQISMGTQLGLICERRGALDRAGSYLEKALALAVGEGDRQGEAMASGYLGFVRQRQGDFSAAEELHRKALALHEQAGNRSQQAEECANLGNLYLAQRAFDRAEAMLRNALELYQEIGEPKGLGIACHSLGNLRRAQGEWEEARAYYEQGIAHHRAAGDELGIALQCMGLGQVCQEAGQLAAAADWFQRGRERFQQAGHPENTAAACTSLGLVRAAQGDYPGAHQALEAALRLHEEMDHPAAVAYLCNQLGAVRLAGGDTDEATAWHQRALKLSREQGDRAGEGFAQVGLGHMAAQQGEITQAIGRFTMAAEHFRQVGMPEQARQAEQALRSLWGRRG